MVEDNAKDIPKECLPSTLTVRVVTTKPESAEEYLIEHSRRRWELKSQNRKGKNNSLKKKKKHTDSLLPTESV